jgi:ribosomal-protein-alanine N-acetyltransferase
MLRDTFRVSDDGLVLGPAAHRSAILRGMVSLPETLTLYDRDLVLRDWQGCDAPALKPVCGDWDVCQFGSVPWTYSFEEASAWIARLHARRTNGSGVALAITRREQASPVGNVNLVRFNPDGREAALGYWLVPAARGQGVAVRAARLLCAWGFRELGLARIELAILPGNAASHAVAERLGARQEGLRMASHEAEGRHWDMVIYSLSPSNLV